MFRVLWDFGEELTARHQALYKYKARWRASAGLLEVKLVCASRAAIVVIVLGQKAIDLRDGTRHVKYGNTVPRPLSFDLIMQFAL